MMTAGGIDWLGRMARRGIAAAMLTLTLPMAVAEANPQLCRQIEAQLAALGSGRGNASTQIRRYDAAIARQQQQLQRAREQAQQRGCSRFLGGISSACRGINTTIERMHGNLTELQRTRAQLGGGGGRGERARLMAALDANRCRAGRPAQQQAARPPAQQAARPAQQTARPAQPPREGMQRAAGANLSTGRLSGNFRTLCVRTCDGYYFPVSYSVPQSAFGRDAAACQAMCPGTRVELHYHRVPGQESEEMVSAETGLPYREMENAFLYRRAGSAMPAGCGCETASGSMAMQAPAGRGFQVIAGDYQSGIVEDEPEEEPKTAAIPLPSDRPDPAEDPETLASREGGLDAAALKRLATPRRAPAADSGAERQVRVVGPVFLPDPEEAIDLRAPDQSLAR